jgi:hypothetical protein
MKTGPALCGRATPAGLRCLEDGRSAPMGEGRSVCPSVVPVSRMLWVRRNVITRCSHPYGFRVALVAINPI